MSEQDKGLHYFVIAAKGEQWLAGFQLREWANEWRERYCATGFVVTFDEWSAIQLEAVRKEAMADASQPKLVPQSHRDWSLLNGLVVGGEPHDYVNHPYDPAVFQLKQEALQADKERMDKLQLVFGSEPDLNSGEPFDLRKAIDTDPEFAEMLKAAMSEKGGQL